MSRQRALAVRNQYSPVPRRKAEYVRILNTFQVGIYGAQKVDGRFAKASTRDNGNVQIRIREESDAHGFFMPIASRARSSLAYSSGFQMLKGMPEASNFLCFSSRY